MEAKRKARISVDQDDVDRFSRQAGQWWDERGPFAPLHWLNPTRIGYIRDQAAARIGGLGGRSLLDVGCGGGLMAEPMARLGATVTGIDASAENIGTALSHAETMGLDITYRAMTAEALVEEGARFDIVLALEIVEHVADVPHFLASLARLVAPGGLLVISTLNRTFKSLALAKIGAEYVLRWLPAGTHQWRQFLRPSEVVEPLEENGLSLAELSGIVYSPLKRTWRMDTHDLDVNYLAVFRYKAFN